MTAAAANLSTSQASLALQVPEHVLRRATAAGVIAVPTVGRVRIFPTDQLADIRAKLLAAGLIPPAAAAVTA